MNQMKPRCKMRLLLPVMVAMTMAPLGLARAVAQDADLSAFQLRGGDGLSDISQFPDDATQDALSVDAQVQETQTQPSVVGLSDMDQGRVRPEQPASAVAPTEPVDPTDTVDPRDNVRERKVESGVPRTEPVNYFERIGTQIGVWRFFARIEEAIGYATNNTFTTGGEPGAFSQTNGTFEARSDWSRHEASLIAAGQLRRSIGSDDVNIPEAAVDGSLRLDLSDANTLTFRGNYDYSTEALTSESLSSSAIDRPGVNQYGGSAEWARSGGLIGLTLRGAADRSTYSTEQLAGGRTQSQNDRNNTLYQVASTISYDPRATLSPYVGGGVGWRVFDEKLDRNGYDRSSFLYDLRAGIRMDFGDKLKGDVSLGYAVEDFNDPRLANKHGPIINGAIDWSPERDTNIGLTASTGLGGSTTAGNIGSIDYSFGIIGERRIRDDLAVNARASTYRSYYPTTSTSDVTYTVGAGIEYWLSRWLSLTADVEYQNYTAGSGSGDWDSASIRAGIAWQN